MELKQIFDLARLQAPDLLDDIAELEARFVHAKKVDINMDDWDDDVDFEDDHDVPGAPAPYMIQLAPEAFEALKTALQKAIPKLVA